LEVPVGILEVLGLREAAVPEGKELVATGTMETLGHRLEELTESYSALIMAREDVGWQKIAQDAAQEFSRQGLKTSAELARVFLVANPLIKRAGALRAAYVHGQGCGTTATGEKVNELIQEWLDDPEVREVFSGAQAAERNEGSLTTDGNVFFSLFTNPLTGRVKPRLIDFDEVEDKITKPGDKTTTWFYLRTWVEVDQNGREAQRKAYYPDITYRPLARRKRIQQGGSTESIEVMWDAPIYHIKVNALNGWKFGIGDAYAALPWARGFKEFLEDWALLMKSLSRIAWQNVGGKKSDAQKRRQQLASMQNMPAGSVVNATEDNKFEAVPKSGATLDSESAKPLAAMVASAMGLPVTMILSDPGQTGARAVAETLDRPTRLEMQSRQEVWREARRQILGYVIEQSVIAPRGPIKGTVERDGDRLRVRLPKPEDMTLTITYPDLEEISLDVIMEALVAATGHMPPELQAEMIMRALKVRDVDEQLEKMKDDDGKFIDPTVTAGQAAADEFRKGNDPAALLK
jgi:hypothetical protein